MIESFKKRNGKMLEKFLYDVTSWPDRLVQLQRTQDGQKGEVGLRLVAANRLVVHGSSLPRL